MITFKYRYPGDPIADCERMTVEEFVCKNPDRSIEITTGDKLVASIPVDDVVCDLCNALLEVDATVYLSHDYLYCTPCAARYILPYELNNN